MNMNKAVELYGSQAELKDLGGRIKAMMPGGQVYTDQEAMGLAQLCLAHDLDAFNGEAWLIKVRGESRGMMVGIKGLRKHAKNQSPYWGLGGADRIGGFRRILDPAELELYKATPKDIVYELVIVDKERVSEWIDLVKKMMDAGLDPSVIGDCPTTVGIGVWKQGESTKMQPNQAAMYRAERDAIRRRFDVNFAVRGLDVQIADATDEVDEAEHINGDVEVVDTEVILQELGFDTNTGVPDVKPYEPAPEPVTNGRPYGPEDLKQAFGKRVQMYADLTEDDLSPVDRRNIVITMEKLFVKDRTECRHKLTEFLFGKPSSKDLSPAEVKATIVWLNWNQDSGGDWKPAAMAVQEASFVIAHLANQPQQEVLF